MAGSDLGGEFPATYVSERGRRRGTVRLDSDGVRLDFGRKLSSRHRWDEVRRFSFEDPGRTKASAGSIALFGVLGLGARKAFSVLMLSLVDRDLLFETDWPVAVWRVTALRMQQDVPEVAGKVWVEGQRVDLEEGA